MAMGTRKGRERQEDLWVAYTDIAVGPGHLFHVRLSEVLDGADFDAFVEKHNRYSNWEATVALESSAAQNAGDLQKSDVGWKRRLKGLVRHLPCRPWLRFCYVYFWQLGFLDGRAGYYFARLHAFYEFLTVAKTYEMKKQRERSE